MFIIYKSKIMSNKIVEDKKLLYDIEREKLDILIKTEKVRGEQLFIDEDSNLSSRQELEAFSLANKSIDDPEKKYIAYYQLIEKLLRKHLPKGIEFATARGFIREEKCVYLTRGKRKQRDGRRGADSRMTYIEDAEKIIDIIIKWILDRGTMVELYNHFRELNVKSGYGTRTIY